jgi:dTDP-D-glucose 4,6-dehydratase
MATVNRKITITGGKQWRPFVHVENVADAIIKALEAPRLLVNGEVFNVGSTDENYRIEQVGDIIKQLLPETDIICRENIIDQRNYFVRFDKIKNILNFATSKTVGDGVKEISQALRIGKIMNYQEPNYNNYLALKDNCHDYISSNKWYDLLQSIESEESADREKETVPLASAVRNKTNPPKADQVTQIRPGRTLAAKF